MGATVGRRLGHLIPRGNRQEASLALPCDFHASVLHE